MDVAVYKWESGQSYPEVSKLLEMKVLFGISIDDLLDDSYEVIVPEKKKRKRAVKVEENLPKEDAVEENITPTEAPIPEVKEEPAVKEEVMVAVEATVAEEIKEEAQAEAIEEKIAEEVTANDASIDEADEDGKKKPGFFGRLFGRK